MLSPEPGRIREFTGLIRPVGFFDFFWGMDLAIFCQSLHVAAGWEYAPFVFPQVLEKRLALGF